MSVRNLINGFRAALLSAALAAGVSGSPARAARMDSASALDPGAASVVSDLRLTDPHRELRHLSKNLKLTRSQRTTVDSIIQERNREIRLLLDVESLSDEHRSTLAAKVMQDSNAQIETFLRTKQKRKFDKELARNRAAH